MNNLKSYTEYAVSTPTTDFVIGFDFNYGTDAVNVTVDDVPATEAGYSVIYLNSTTMRLNPAVPSGVVRLQRETDIDVPDNQFTAGAKFIASNMDENFTQIRHAQQEVRDGFEKLSDDTYEIIDTLQVVGQAAQDAADAAEQAAQTANAAAAQVNDKVSYQDLDDAVDASVLSTISAGIPATAIKDISGKTQQTLNTTIFKNTYYAELEGFIGDGLTDNFAVWQTLKSKLNNGDTVIFRTGRYYFGDEISIDKVISIEGCLRTQALGTVFEFRNTSGVVRKAGYTNIKNISIAGTKTSTPLDFNSRVFGTVGLRELYDGVYSAGGGILENVFIVGFDVNRLTALEGTAVWAGAYRENINVCLRSGRWAYVALDGATHEKFTGGIISANSEGGIWSDAKNIAPNLTQTYNNINLFGVTMEANGKQTSDFNSSDTYNLNIYSGANSKINIFGGYNELVNNMAEHGGEINYFGSYQHPNTKNYASDASVSDSGGYAPYANKLKIDAALSEFLSISTGCTLSKKGGVGNGVVVSSSTNGVVSFQSPTVVVGGILGKEVKAVKFSFQYTFTSGFTANSELLVQPVIRLVSATPNRADANIINRNFPTSMLIKSYNKAHTASFYYFPRKGDTVYLDANAILNSLQVIFQVKNNASDPNFSVDNLNLIIENIEVELLTTQPLDIKFSVPTSGATSNRPNLPSLRAGFVYYDTTLGRNVVWDGSTWTEKQTPIESSNTAAMSAIGNPINTSNKYFRFVYNTTNGKIYYPTNATAAAVWRATDGTADITPA